MKKRGMWNDGEYILFYIPRYAAVSLVAALAWNSVIYNGAILLRRGAEMWDMTTALEEAIPLQPGWIFVYFGCFLFWGVNYILISRRGREAWFRFLLADLLAELICGLFFLFMPTTNLRPEVMGTDFASMLVRLLYQIDPAQNLFPSIHCMVSWFCFIGVRGDKRFPVWYQAFNCLFALAVCMSTLFLKQHCIPDAVAGVLLAEATNALSQRTSLYLPLQRLFERLRRGGGAPESG